MMNKYQAWAVAFSIMAIASGTFPKVAKADGCPECQIDPQPPCEHPDSEHCVVTCLPTADKCPPAHPQPIHHELYSKHKPYCGYLNKHDPEHWSDRYNEVETAEDASSETTSFKGEPETSEHLVASTNGYAPLSSPRRRNLTRQDMMQGENALVLFIGLGLWVALRPLFGKKEVKKDAKKEEKKA
ncbi:MAG: hypothetical protein SWJ54_18210 [Cyanobacteriota bacterium]|nr:hypothetical protein [Cyanobacteriota bacterium]